MKRKLFSVLAIIAILLAGMSPSSALAGGYDTDFVTSITYQNVGTGTTTTLNVLFYESPTDTTAQTVNRTNLAPGASSSLYIGSVISTSFSGTAVLAADQPMAAALVQVPPNGSPVRVRPLSVGFSSGTPQSTIPTVQKNAGGANGEGTVFVVQNAGTCPANANVRFYAPGNPTAVHTIPVTLQPSAGAHFDAQTISQLGSSFSGSVIVDGTCTTSGTPLFVTSAMELGLGGNNAAKAFEGGTGVAGTLFMPSAMCAAGTPGQTTYYAVQNTSASTTSNVTVFYSNGKSTTKSVSPGAKGSFSGCEPANNIGFAGSAYITATGGVPIIAVGKVANSTGQLSTAFAGISQGAQKLALPYVRWGNSAHYFAGVTQRTYIAIQNIGAAIPAGQNIVVKYVDFNGNVQSTHTITGGLAANAKTNSRPNMGTPALDEFGCYTNCTVFGGGAVIEGPAGSQLAVVARLTTWNGFADVGEDYNGIPMP